jgi:ketosteroid isomerase-like protein
MPPTVADWLAGYRRAWIERDADAAAALFTEDALYRRQPYEEPLTGPAGIRAYWAKATATQEAVDLQYGRPVVEGDRAAVEWWVTLVNEDAEVTLAGSFMLLFDESGLCRELREYWHVGEGRLRPPAGWGA